MIKAIFFDLDETLVDATETHRLANRAAYAKYGYDFDEIKARTPWLDGLGKRIEEIFRERRDAAGYTEKELPLQGLMAERERAFMAIFKTNSKLIDGAAEAVKETKEKGIIVGVVSSGWREYIKAALEHFQLTDWVDFYIGAEDVKHGKPQPDCYLKAYEKVADKGIKKDECLAVEDANNGVKAGQAAGIKVVFIPSKINKPIGTKADYELKSIKELNQLLNELVKNKKR